jgi:hypothetical protein
MNELSDADQLFDILIDEITLAILNGELFDINRFDGRVAYFHRTERSFCYLLNEDKHLLDSIYVLELYKFSFDKKTDKKTHHINGVEKIISRVQDKFYNTNPYKQLECDLTEPIDDTTNDLGLDFDLIDELELEIIVCEEMAEDC